MEKLDGVEKTAVGIGCFLVLLVLFFIGLGSWGFVELITWITSK